MKYCGKEKISVIVIVFNVEKYIEDCVKSITDQTYESLEIILVDDGSVDGSGELCDKCAEADNRIKVVHKINGGLVGARQAGIREATGEYVAFVDGDDWIDPDMYEKLYLIAKLYHSDIVLSGIVREYPDQKRCDCNAVANGPYNKAALEDKIYPKMMYSMENRSCLIDPSLCNKLFAADKIRQALMQVDDRIFYLGEDAATTFPCLLSADSIYVTDFCMYHHRIVIENKEETYKRERVYERLLYFYKNLQTNFRKTKYAPVMEKQLAGYFLHLLNVVTREAIQLDIGLFYQYVLEGGKENQTKRRSFVYRLPLEKLAGYKNIVLYGAGKVGRDYYTQLLQTEINIKAWCDKDFVMLSSCGVPVSDIGKMKDKEYDIIILAAKRQEMADNMRKYLVGMGIQKAKIKWVTPDIAEE